MVMFPELPDVSDSAPTEAFANVVPVNVASLRLPLTLTSPPSHSHIDSSALKRECVKEGGGRMENEEVEKRWRV